MEGRDFIAVELGAHLIDFFAPMPCSPLMLPPTSTQSSRISRPVLPRGQIHRVRWHRKGLRVHVAVSGMKDVGNA